jgi:hypothetical protein
MAGGQRLISWLHPCSTSNVLLNMRTCAHGPLMGHPNWAGCDIHPPQRTRRPRRSNSLVQCRPIRHAVRPILGPHAHAYVRTLTRANVQEPSLLAHDRTSSVDPYAMLCPILGPHATCALCPHTDPYAQLRGSALIPFVTPCPPKPHRPALP